MNNSKIILGINAFHADASACLIIDGKLKAAMEEERLNRIKHYPGFPYNAIKECLSIGSVDEKDITDIAFNTKPFSNLIPKGIHFLKNLSLKGDLLNKQFLKKKNINKILSENFNLNSRVKFHYIEHHLAHIASAFYPSELKDANGLSIDGSGDFVSFAYAKCKNEKIIIKDKNYFPNSLGIFYHAMTQFLGFQKYGDEYKIMGLAAYGEPVYFEKIKENLFTNDKELFCLNLDFFNHHKQDFKYVADKNLIIDKIFNAKLEKIFSKEMTDKNFQKNFASSVQKVYEFFFKKIINSIVKKNYSKNIVFSGGCALNSSANKFITDKGKKFEKVFINYAPGDNGGALGAAFVVASKYNQKLSNIRSPYLGREFNKNQIEEILKKVQYSKKLTFDYLHSEEELFETASKYIIDGKVIGWFQGKMEFGPRALGNRSILADPRNPNMKDIINKKIKRRESFRPFAPSVLEEFQSEWFESEFFNPYMSSLATVREEKRKMIPAVTHFDNTARLQTVNKKLNQKFHGLLNYFNKLTNVPILLNTSFNENEPIVLKPEEALECILRTDMDAIFIHNFFVKKLAQ